MSQTTQILEHLQSGETLAALEALRLFGCMRLAPRIKQIRKLIKRHNLGYDIKTEMERKDGKTYGRYRLMPFPYPEVS